MSHLSDSWAATNAVKQFFVFFVVLILAGCAPIATVKPTTPRFAAIGSQQPALEAAGNKVRDAEDLKDSNPLQALGSYLASARAAFDRLKQHPDEKRTRDLYNFSVARSVAVIEDAQLNPWDRALRVPSPEGEYSLTNVRHPGADRDPAAYDIIPTDSLAIGGKYLDRRVRVEGIGAPVVAVGREEKK